MSHPFRSTRLPLSGMISRRKKNSRKGLRSEKCVCMCKQLTFCRAVTVLVHHSVKNNVQTVLKLATNIILSFKLPVLICPKLEGETNHALPDKCPETEVPPYRACRYRRTMFPLGHKTPDERPLFHNWEQLSRGSADKRPQRTSDPKDRFFPYSIAKEKTHGGFKILGASQSTV